MTTQLYNAELVDLLRSNFPDRQRYANFDYNVNANWYDYALTGNADSDHFNDNSNTYPAGWTEVDAGTTVNTNTLYGFWFISVYPLATTSWKYRKQTNYDIEAETTSGDWVTFQWGPIFFWNGDYPQDVTYYFGFYADNSGAIDEDKFLRIVIQWDSSGGVWRTRGERKDGTTQTNGAWSNFSSIPTVFPIFVRQTIRFRITTGTVVRTYLGSVSNSYGHHKIFDDVMQITWGQVWLQAHMTRSSGGDNDTILIGAIDRSDVF